MAKSSYQLIRRLAQAIFDKKGSQIIAIDVCGISSITDYVLIANGNVERHVSSLAREIEAQLKRGGTHLHRIEGHESSGWVILDYFDLMIHLFTPAMRQKYQLDRLWPDGEIIAIDLVLPSVQTVQS
ncbi:MAG: ribosome silencing factor [Chlamydiota bacterium]